MFQTTLSKLKYRLNALRIEFLRAIELLSPGGFRRFLKAQAIFRELWTTFYLGGGLSITTRIPSNLSEKSQGFYTVIQADGDILSFHSHNVDQQSKLWNQHRKAIHQKLTYFQEHVSFIKNIFHGWSNMIAVFIGGLYFFSERSSTQWQGTSIFMTLLWVFMLVVLRKVVLCCGLFWVRRKLPLKL
ncbi:MAG: hypothetical protein ACE5FY_06040 [Nitrospiria bacterium]